MGYVPGRFDEAIDVLRANFEDSANSRIDRQQLFARFPVENHLGLRSHKPSLTELIGNEWLKNQCVRGRTFGISSE